uniref:E3 ubiquitin-protein ligase DCST1-like C-terminal domain-containing protein n=1 Tax=Gasterosteus aculeatus TaxID=69293 RepID=G3N9G8_GASAC
ARPALSCLSCGETVRGDDVVACDVPRCAGLFCRPCFLSLESTCAVCTRPLTSGEEGEEELDSSDDEQLNSGAGGSDIIDSDSQLSEADMTYQDRPGSDDSDDSFHSASSRRSSPQDPSLQSVLVHAPE